MGAHSGFPYLLNFLKHPFLKRNTSKQEHVQTSYQWLIKLSPSHPTLWVFRNKKCRYGSGFDTAQTKATHTHCQVADGLQHNIDIILVLEGSQIHSFIYVLHMHKNLPSFPVNCRDLDLMSGNEVLLFKLISSQEEKHLTLRKINIGNNE